MRKDPRLNAASKEAFIRLCRADAQLFVNRQVNHRLD
jgi:hypothetical protein